MNDPTLTCQDEQRRHKVRAEDFNGLDYLEVYDDNGRPTLVVYFLNKLGEARERITKENVLIQGGRRVTDIKVVDIGLCIQEDPERDDCMQVWLDRYGDFSAYTLCLVEVDEHRRPILAGERRGRRKYRPLDGFDPRYACLEFSFKAGCPSDLDCKPQDICPPPERDEPEINYLAKDYASFRQLILDRLALIMPDWQERHVPDLGIALVEVLAYVGDHLSYYQDAVATEAYLGTARQRISVRRHARLVDYAMHEGNNARAWVFVEVADNLELEPDDTAFVTRLSGALPLAGTVLAEHELQGVPGDQYEWFEPLVKQPDVADRRYQALKPHQRWVVEEVEGGPEPIQLRRAHNLIRFYTWGDHECCLPKGATTATLYDGRAVEIPIVAKSDYQQESIQQSAPEKSSEESVQVKYERELELERGDFLLFEELRGPKTDNPADADPRHRHVVRITDFKRIVDELCQQPVLEITWAEEDALPFPLCISAVTDPPDCKLIKDISIARGNIILVDHGRRVRDEDLDCVPVEETRAECECGRLSDVSYIPGRFRPRLERGPLAFSQPQPKKDTPATEQLRQDPRRAIPWIQLASFADPDCPPEELQVAAPEPEEDECDDDKAADDPIQETDQEAEPEPKPLPVIAWEARPDLLSSGPGDAHFVAEVDNESRAHLRFGDGELGDQPEAGARFVATYRVGGGPAGNVGAETISHLVYRRFKQDGIRSVRNPLPAAGGTGPEPMEDVKLFAPHAFRCQLERAITADDYAQIVMRQYSAQVQQAAAALRWTGSWHEVLVAIDAKGGAEPDQELLDEIRGYLYPYRRVGHDLMVEPAHQVPLDIELEVCVLPDYLAGHVKAALLAVFSNRTLPDGRLGFFHPDKLTFGQGIYLSQLVAEAQAVLGVENVQVNKLERLFEGPNGEIKEGVLSLGPLEVARLDNDPIFPENGQLTLIMRGGR
jgi:hypothetical protein